LSTSFWAIARRPKWIGVLVLALAIAAAFAALGQWQLERSFESEVAPDQQTEVVVDLQSVAEPQQPVMAAASGQLVRFEAEFVPGDYVVLSDRIDLSGAGYWVVGHAVVSDGASLAVALGWVAERDAAASAIRRLESEAPGPQLQGRYLPTESPQETDFENGQRSVLAVPELVNIWTTPPDGAYGGYVILGEAPVGLETIDAPPPSTEVSLNLLNVFYAIEWVIFAGFAIFLWYRLVKDAWEEETSPEAPVE
jgi:cytochrome oxidase assembly protein ShyY1